VIFNQVRHGRISDDIVAQVKNAIFSGVFRPGDKLPPETEMKKMFNVSRVPLREALRSLEEMGLVTIKPGVLGGAFVAQMGIKSVSDSLANMMRLGKITIRDIWELRILIEPNICELASERCSSWDIKQIEDLLAVRETAVRTRKTPVVSNIDFHQALARSINNPLAILIMDAIGEILMENFKKFTFSLRDHQKINEFHREILGYVKKRNGKRAGELMKGHLSDVGKRLKIWKTSHTVNRGG
jgi:GntR family transcriptional repressor for pyruvate dehydrogenase complex